MSRPRQVTTAGASTDMASPGDVYFHGDYTGVADEVANLEAFMAINSTVGSVGYNRKIHLKAGTLKFSRALDPALGVSVLLKGQGKFSTIIKYPYNKPAINTTNAMLYQRNNAVQVDVTSITTETADDGSSFTTNVDQVHVLNVADSSAFASAVGRWVSINSGTLHPVTAESARMGCAMKVWGTVAGKIYLAGLLPFDPAYLATAVTATLLLEDVRFDVSDIGFTADGTFSDTGIDSEFDDDDVDSPSGAHSHCIIPYGIPYSQVYNCRGDKMWEGFVFFDSHCPGSRAYNNESINLVNLRTKAESLGANPLTATSGSSTIVVTHTAHGRLVGAKVNMSHATASGNVTTAMLNKVQTITAVGDADHYSFVISVNANFTGTFGGSSIVDLSGRLGYHYNIGPCCDGTVIENNWGSEGRHFDTSTHHSISVYTKASWYKAGIPCNVTVRNNVIVNVFAIPLDEHESATNWTHEGNQIYWFGEGPQSGSYVGYMGQARGSGGRWANNRSYGGQYGVRIPAVERLYENIATTLRSRITLENNYFENLYSSQDTVPTTGNSNLQGLSTRCAALIIDDHSSITALPEIHINGHETYNVNQSIVHLGGAIKVYAKGLNFKRGGIPIECLGNGEIWVMDQAVFDFRNTTRTPAALNCVAMWSLKQDKSTAAAGAKVIFMTQPVVIKDSSAKPVALFHEADTTANKTYKAVGGFKQINIGAVTDTLLLTASSSTLVESTEVKIIGADKSQLPFNVEAPSNKTYCVCYKMAHPGVITTAQTGCTSGTATATWKINTTALGGAANSTAAAGDSVTHTTNNAFVAGDTINVTISANASCVDFKGVLTYQRTG